MDLELEDKLFNKFPQYFPGGRKVSPKQSLICFGCEHGDGWYQLLLDLCTEADKLGHKFQVTQIKEKFGMLCFYIHNKGGGTGDVYDLIRKYENESGVTCETCGKPGKLLENDRFWIRTLCVDCDKK